MAAITSAVVGVGGGVASSIQGFVGAAKQKRAAQEAEKEAKKFIGDARRRAGQKVYDTLSIPMEAYAAGVRGAAAVRHSSVVGLAGG